MADVELVETELFGQDALEVIVHDAGAGEELFFVAVDDGGGAGDAGANGKDFTADIFGPTGGDGGIFGAGADKAHLAEQDVPQLRQLVDFGVAQPAAKGGDAGIVAGGEGQAVVAGGGFVHGAEFEDFEFTPGAAEARTAVKDGAGRIAADGGGNDEEDGREEHEAEEGNEQVGGALESGAQCVINMKAMARLRALREQDGPIGLCNGFHN